MSVQDQRQDTRYSFTSDVIVNESVFTNAIDISLGGLYIRTAELLEPGSTVSLSIPDYGFNIKALVRFSREGEGTGLKFEPENNDQWNALASVIEEIRDRTDDETVKPTLLVVDDNRAFREALKAKLSEAGYSVAEAADGMEAIRQMNNYPFHAVLVDLHMERIDGFKLINLIREAPDHREKPIIAMSGDTSPGNIERAKRSGANYFLPKTEEFLAEVFKTLTIVLGAV
jgi:CheY-like chemotaxis protein